MVFEIGNVKNPNSTRNTVVFSMFEAPDTPHNLKLGLQRYKEDIEKLQKHTWR